MKKFFATFLCLVLCGGLLPAQAAGPEVNAKAVLLMEKTTGQVLYEEHAHDPLELASVTKVMTMLLIMEALEEGTITKETMVPVSATAAGMGGSQVYMKEGESFSVHDMLRPSPWPPATTPVWPWRNTWPAVRAPLWKR